MESPIAIGDQARPDGITAGPDGNLWFAENGSQNVDVFTPTARPRRLASRPPSVAPGAAFGLTVSVFYQSGPRRHGLRRQRHPRPGHRPGGATLGGTLTVAAHDGVATFSGLTIDQPGTLPDRGLRRPAIDHADRRR